MADTEVGVHLSVNDDATPKVKDFKKEVKLAQQELLRVTEIFGGTSKEAQNAAKHVALLRDKIDDARKLTEAFNPDRKFQAFSASLQGVVGGFAALQGAMGLFGVQSEEVQKTLLKVQSALALSQGINSILELKDQFSNLFTVINNGLKSIGAGGWIAIAIAAVTIVIAKFKELKEWITGIGQEQKFLNEINTKAAKIYVEERSELDKKINVLKSVSSSTREKGKAIRELQEQYPGYFRNLRIERGEIVGLTEDYKKVIDAIKLKARAQAASQLLTEQEKKLLGIMITEGVSSEEELKEKLKGAPNVVRNLIQRTIDEVTAGRDQLRDIVAETDLLLAKSTGNVLGQDIGKTGKGGTGGDKEKVDLVAPEREKFRQQAELELTHFDAQLGRATAQNQSLIELSRLRTGLEIGDSLQRMKQAEAEADAKIQFVKDIGGALGALSVLIGEQTAAGKVLAIAEATINTWLGVTQVLRAKSVLPEPAATISKVINVATIVATGLGAVKKILAVKVPGGGGSGGGLSVAPPLAPSPQVTNTLLNQQQLNQIGNAAVRAFVVESDVTNNQERIKRLNRASRI